MGIEGDAEQCGPRACGTNHCFGSGHIYHAGCPGRLVLDRIGDRWTVLVVGILQDGTKRFSELRHAVGGITAKVLTQTLRAMERDGLLSRKVYAEVPPRVEYTLTELGESLNEPINAIRTWTEQNMGQLFATRARYDLEHAQA